MSIVRSYTENHEIIREYTCDSKKIVEGEDGIPIKEVDKCILDALGDTNGDLSRIDIEEEDRYIWWPI